MKDKLYTDYIGGKWELWFYSEGEKRQLPSKPDLNAVKRFAAKNDMGLLILKQK